MRFRDYIISRAIQTVVTVLIVLVLMFVLFRAMPSDPVSMIVDPRWGPRQVHEVAVRYGFERDATDRTIYQGNAEQDMFSGNNSKLVFELVNSSWKQKHEIGSGTLWYAIHLKWSNTSNSELYIAAFLDGSRGAPSDGKAQVEELFLIGNKPLNQTQFGTNRIQTIEWEQSRERINEVDNLIIVVFGKDVKGNVPFTIEIDRTYIVKVSMWEQFVVYMKSMLTGDFGRSFYSQRPVVDELGQRIPTTLVLFGTASIIGPIFGIGGGTLLAWKRGSKVEIGSIMTLLFFYSMPIFWLGMIMLWVFANHLGWFPLGGMVDTTANYTGFAYFVDVLYHMALPLMTMMIAGLAGGMLLMRNSMLEVVGEDYITTAKAKGLSEKKVMYKHAARNAMLPVVTSIAMGVGAAISGGVLTETIFNWPGVGRYLVTSTLQQDFPVVQATFFILALITIISNVIADLLYAYLDPRVRI